LPWHGLTVTIANNFIFLEVIVLTHTKQKAAAHVAAILTMVLAILVTVGFTGCQLTSLLPQTGGSQSSTSSQPLGGDLPDQEPPIIVPSFLHPLTGLESTEYLANARPVSVCVGNTAYALPQYGLSSADILVEIPVEGGISRLMMITNAYESIAKIGSVRSTRPGLSAVANSFDAIQLFAGTSDEGQSSILPYDTMDYLMQNLPSVYYRDEDRNAPHNLMTSGDLIKGGIQTFGYRTELDEGFTLPYCFSEYGKTVTPTDGSALAVHMAYSPSQAVEFLYDVDTQTYARKQYGETHIDGNSEEALTFQNVFVLFANTVTHETENGATLDLSVAEGGSGIWCSQGTWQSITWSMSEDGTMQFYDSNHEIITVNRGKSYIGFMKASMTQAVKVQ